MALAGAGGRDGSQQEQHGGHGLDVGLELVPAGRYLALSPAWAGGEEEGKA